MSGQASQQVRESVAALERLRQLRDPARVSLAERRFYNNKAADIAQYAKLKRDPRLTTLLEMKVAELRRSARASAALSEAWSSVIRNPLLRDHTTPVHAKGVIVVYVPSQSVKYLMERELRGGGWIELQRAMPVALSKYRVQVGTPPSEVFPVPPREESATLPADDEPSEIIAADTPA